MHETLICQYCSPIYELFHSFKPFITHLCALIVSCVLLQRGHTSVQQCNLSHDRFLPCLLQFITTLIIR
jgi:hypothetical protein